MGIYDLLKECNTYKIDLIKKNLWINGKQYIKQGVNLTDLPLIQEECDLDELYQEFKHSVPSPKASRSYFKALSLDGLTDYDLATRMPRFKAQALLEGYILLARETLAEKFTGTHYFWQSETDPDFVILRDWV